MDSGGQCQPVGPLCGALPMCDASTTCPSGFHCNIVQGHCSGCCAPGNTTTGACKTNGDCRLFDDYCTGCNCRVLGIGEPDPVCSGKGVQCLVAPCGNAVAVCDQGHCILTKAPSGGCSGESEECGAGHTGCCDGLSCESISGPGDSRPFDLCVRPGKCVGPGAICTVAKCCTGTCTAVGPTAICM